MSDYSGNATRVAVDSDILRIYPNALIQIFIAGTDTLEWEDTADQYGNWSVPTLATGKYDIKIDGQIRATIHHVTADHTHNPDETWQFFKSGQINSDAGEVNTMQVCGSDVAGSLAKVMVVVQNVDITADVTVHILKGAAGGAGVLALATDSVWNYRVNPGSAQKRFLHVDNNPGISIAADECITVGYDYTAGGVYGLTVLCIFRPT